eukprot:Rmarinus@m.966
MYNLDQFEKLYEDWSEVRYDDMPGFSDQAFLYCTISCVGGGMRSIRVSTRTPSKCFEDPELTLAGSLHGEEPVCVRVSDVNLGIPLPLLHDSALLSASFFRSIGSLYATTITRVGSGSVLDAFGTNIVVVPDGERGCMRASAWSHPVRIGGHNLSLNDAETSTLASACCSALSVVISGASFLELHGRNNYDVVYNKDKCTGIGKPRMWDELDALECIALVINGYHNSRNNQNISWEDVLSALPTTLLSRLEDATRSLEELDFPLWRTWIENTHRLLRDCQSSILWFARASIGMAAVEAVSLLNQGLVTSTATPHPLVEAPFSEDIHSIELTRGSLCQLDGYSSIPGMLPDSLLLSKDLHCPDSRSSSSSRLRHTCGPTEPACAESKPLYSTCARCRMLRHVVRSSGSCLHCEVSFRDHFGSRKPRAFVTRFGETQPTHCCSYSDSSRVCVSTALHRTFLFSNPSHVPSTGGTALSSRSNDAPTSSLSADEVPPTSDASLSMEECVSVAAPFDDMVVKAVMTEKDDHNEGLSTDCLRPCRCGVELEVILSVSGPRHEPVAPVCLRVVLRGVLTDPGLCVGDVLKAGEKVGTVHALDAGLSALSVGVFAVPGGAGGAGGAGGCVAGGWADTLECDVSQRTVALGVTVDPAFLVPAIMKHLSHEPEPQSLLLFRKMHLGPNLSIAYASSDSGALTITRSFAQYLYDFAGDRYLDGVNNVPHVGHGHPEVVNAIARQAHVLNTNTRYLYPLLNECAKRLLSVFPPGLEIVFFTCSGSESNELAVRIARTHTRRQNIVVVEGGYHGNSNLLVGLSSYKFSGKGGMGKPGFVELAPIPCGYRGKYRLRRPCHGDATSLPGGITIVDSEEEIAVLYAEETTKTFERCKELWGEYPAAFMMEPLVGCGGQVIPPKGYLRLACESARARGIVTIMDEVQVGFGRVGECMWAFQRDEFVPDIVTLGKPMGNGHPIAGVVVSKALAASFHNGMEYFNTFGGNPVSCCAVMAVLRAIEEEKLLENALTTGRFLVTELSKLQGRYPIVGEVRGVGLYVGVELVLDTSDPLLPPATQEAAFVVNRMRERHVLVSTDGPLNNVIKIKPPICFTKDDARVLTAAFKAALNDLELFENQTSQ